MVADVPLDSDAGVRLQASDEDFRDFRHAIRRQRTQTRDAMTILWQVATVCTQWLDVVRVLGFQHSTLSGMSGRWSVSHGPFAPRYSTTSRLTIQSDGLSRRQCHYLSNVLNRCEGMKTLILSVANPSTIRNEHLPLVALDDAMISLGDFANLTDMVWDCEQIDIFFFLHHLPCLRRLQVTSETEYTWGDAITLGVRLPALEFLHVCVRWKLSCNILDLLSQCQFPSMNEFVFYAAFQDVDASSLLSFLHVIQPTVRSVYAVVGEDCLQTGDYDNFPPSPHLELAFLSMSVAERRLNASYPALHTLVIEGRHCQRVVQPVNEARFVTKTGGAVRVSV